MSIAGTKIHVARWEHRHGVDTLLYSSAEGAAKWRQEIAAEWWETEMKGQTMPVDPEAAAEEYFNTMMERDEFFTVEECVVAS
jgi:hypothetical protein